MRSWMKTGLGAGVAFSFVGVTFVAVSLFTDISRSAWVVLDNAKGVVGFGFCALAGLLAARKSHGARSGAVAGALGGAIAGAAVPVSMYVLAYGFLDWVRQYPFEYYDYLNTGASSVRAFLLSSKGHATVLSTSPGLVPVVVAFAALLGGTLGYLGGRVGVRWSGGPPAPVRIKPLQRTSGADDGSALRRVASAAHPQFSCLPLKMTSHSTFDTCG